MKRDRIIERLIKIKALSEGGVGGERIAAERLLMAMMKQYGISPEQLEEDTLEYRLAYIGDDFFDFKLFVQIAYKFYRKSGEPRILDLRKVSTKDRKAIAKAGMGPKNANVGVFCTKAEFIEMMSAFELYKTDFFNQVKTFYYAYLDTNDLLIKSKGDRPVLTTEEIDRIMNAERMKAGIKKVDIYKQIEAK